MLSLQSQAGAMEKLGVGVNKIVPSLLLGIAMAAHASSQMSGVVVLTPVRILHQIRSLLLLLGVIRLLSLNFSSPKPTCLILLYHLFYRYGKWKCIHYHEHLLRNMQARYQQTLAVSQLVHQGKHYSHFPTDSSKNSNRALPHWLLKKYLFIYFSFVFMSILTA